MEKLTLSITDEDIASATRFEVDNPVLHKLHTTTGTLWRLCSDGLAMEIMTPFRTTLLPTWALCDWHANSAHEGSAANHVLPCEIELELVPLLPVRNAAFHATMDEIRS